MLFPILRNATGKAVRVLPRWVHSGIARLIATLLPPRLWYWPVFRLSYWTAPVFRLRPAGPDNDRFHQALLLNRFLGMFTRAGRPFPIPYRVVGATALLEAARDNRGMILCSAHVPLVKVGLRAVMEMGLTPTAAIVETPTEDQRIAIWGLDERLPAILVAPNVLVRARTVLRNHGSVALLIDARSGLPYSPNILRLAGKMGARVVFFFTELQPDGHIEVLFLAPPDPYCSSEETIQANLQALDREVQRILGRTSSVAIPEMAPQER